MLAKLRCRVSPGQFSSEFAVVVRSFAGREFSLFADRSDLEVPIAPTEDEDRDGWLTVTVVEQHAGKGLALVRLPQSTLENGPFLTVYTSQLRAASGRAAQPV